MTTRESRHWRTAEDFESGWVERHLEAERRRADLLSEVREMVFGAQDGVLSTLAVVSAVGGATGDAFHVLVAGLATAAAGMFAMAAGEYMSSRSQHEIFEAQIAAEAVEVSERPAEAQAEVAFLLQREGLGRDAAFRVAAEMAAEPPVLLRTMVEKELGLTAGGDQHVLRGALLMGASFGVASLIPIAPYLLLPVRSAVLISVVLTVVLLFAMGAVKSRWTRRSWLRSGLETFSLGAIAGIAGYLLGSVLPELLGVANLAG
jgi:vacuolar iron transporter family protein